MTSSVAVARIDAAVFESGADHVAGDGHGVVVGAAFGVRDDRQVSFAQLVNYNTSFLGNKTQ